MRAPQTQNSFRKKARFLCQVYKTWTAFVLYPFMYKLPYVRVNKRIRLFPPNTQYALNNERQKLTIPPNRDASLVAHVEALIDSRTLKKRCALVAHTEIQQTQEL